MTAHTFEGPPPLESPPTETAIHRAACERCEWVFALPAHDPPEICPHCFQAPLTRLESAPANEDGPPKPELVLPFALAGETIARHILAFADKIPFSPADLTPERLVARLERVYLPMWLVDVEVVATWGAEVGFEYEVVSHQGQYNDRQGWVTQEVSETRVRWEPRAGQLERRYSNLVAPALEHFQDLTGRLGEFHHASARPSAPDLVQGASLRLPDRPVEDAWNDVEIAVRLAAAGECQRAAGGEHIRQYQWSPDYRHRAWSLMLLPVYSTYYRDDEGNPQPVLIHGQTGRVSGRRRASMLRARRAARWLLAAAGVLLLMGLAATGASLVWPGFLVFGVVGLFLSVLTGLGAAIPVLVAWGFNRSQTAVPGGGQGEGLPSPPTAPGRHERGTTA